jgi:hypothetical protein
MSWAGQVPRLGEKRNVYGILAGKLERKRPLRRPRRRFVDNIKTDVGEVECGVMDGISLAEDRYKWRALINTVMNHRVP